MARVMLAWELGGGAGHLHKLQPLIDPLQKRGHSLVAAVKDVAGARRVFGDAGMPIFPAPLWYGSTLGMRPAASFAEVLFRVGYLEPDDIAAQAASWAGLLRLNQVQLLIAEHAPTAIIAARTLGIPYLTIGTGFSVPPDISPMPSLEPWHRVPPNRLQQADQQATATINKVLDDAAVEPIDNLAALYHSHPTLMLTLPELDHYGVRDNVRYWGPLVGRNRPKPAPVWPSGKGEKVFVYLHPGYRQFNGMLQQLLKAPYRSLIVAPGVPGPMASKLSNDRVRLTSQAVDMKAVVKSCRVIMNHAAHGTMAHVFSYGRPMLLLPNFVEQTVLAWRASNQKLGLMANPDPSKHNYKAMISRFLDSKELFEHTDALAQRYRANPFDDNELYDHLDQQIRQQTA